MKKYCIINAFLAFLLFGILIWFLGYLCGQNFFETHTITGEIFFIVYYFIVVIVACALIHIDILSTKVFIFASIFSSAAIILVWLIGLISWLPNRNTLFISNDPVSVGVYIAITILSLIISIIYLIVIIKNQKKHDKL